MKTSAVLYAITACIWVGCAVLNGFTSGVYFSSGRPEMGLTYVCLVVLNLICAFAFGMLAYINRA